MPEFVTDLNTHSLSPEVMATDIMDGDLNAARKARWNKAFADHAGVEDAGNSRNRKATIVIEHLIQASDVSHTMQHWHVFRKWNEKLFAEQFKAYKEGRAATNPADNWYQGELKFFDLFIIPLAKKLKDCGVFGAPSDEYLDYAVNNRREWAAKGREQVEMYLEKYSGMPWGKANPKQSEVLQDGSWTGFANRSAPKQTAILSCFQH